MTSRRDLTIPSMLLALSFAAALASCASTLPVESVDVSGERRLPAGVTTRLTATASIAGGRLVHDVTASAIWTSSDASVASVAGGLVQAVGPGIATISATRSGVSGAVELTVTQASLTSVDLGPAFALPAGVGKRLTATGTFSDLTTRDLTTSLTWTTSAPSIATVSDASGSSGLVTSVAPGIATIRATHPTTGIGGSAVVTVSSAQLVSIAISPVHPSVPLGNQQQFTAVGTYTDGRTQDLTASVGWSSSPLAVASIATVGAARGLASTTATGTTTISAKDPATGISTSTALTVTAARLSSLAITPPAPSIALGAKQQLTATGTYTDLTTHDLTGTVLWGSSDAAIAQVSNTAGANGLASGAGVGSATVRATDEASGLSATTTLTVTAARLVSIAVTPATSSLPVGLTQQFAATGTYTDGTTHDLTAAVTWTSSAPSAASISNAATSVGLATALTVGAPVISATEAASGISGSTPLTVTAARLAAIAVTPTAQSIPSGLAVQFTATGTYTDASTQPLTASVTWSSSTPAIASISNAAGSEGMATGGAVGDTTITALDPATNLAASTTLTVTAAQLVSVTVTPASPSITAGQAQQFIATGTYTDSSAYEITTSVTWTSSDIAVATISNAQGSNGLATAAPTVPGSSTTTITAVVPGTTPQVSGTATLTVAP